MSDMEDSSQVQNSVNISISSSEGQNKQETRIQSLFDNDSKEGEEDPSALKAIKSEASDKVKAAIANIFGDSDSDLDDLGEVKLSL
jgi:hypothetical protein